jgi:hypothetical protein
MLELKELKAIWNEAHKTSFFKPKFPLGNAPLNLGEHQPPDAVVSHEEFRKIIQNIMDRLERAVEEIEQSVQKGRSVYR